MPKISKQKRENRRQQILDAASACFSENGFHQTGMADIVRKSSLSHGTVYVYFQSKDDLIEALAVDRHQQEAVLNSAAHASADPVAGLHTLLEAYARWLTDRTAEQGRRVGVNGWAEALRSERVRAGVIQGIAAPRALIVDLVERAQADGAMSRDLNADAIARTLIALFQGLTLQMVWGEPLESASLGNVVSRMLDGLMMSPGRRESGHGTR